MARILLLGMNGELRDQLSRVLHDQGHNLNFAEFHDSWLDDNNTELVFACGDDGGVWRALRQARTWRPELPVVVMTRLPEYHLWLDALEAGAADYCGAPFEPTQIQWVMSSALPEAA